MSCKKNRIGFALLLIVVLAIVGGLLWNQNLEKDHPSDGVLVEKCIEQNEEVVV